MEILTVSGRNIRSLHGDFNIDFKVSGLVDAGLFAITGPTGSGKSSILDTITLALYGQCPRTSDTGRGQAELDGIGASDPRTAMSRGAGEARAEVTFHNNGIQYRAFWSVHRAYNKPDGSIQPAQRSIINVSEDRVLADKIRECDAEIHRITGLDYPQFTRSVILAQGDFAAFLEADPSTRGALLESITGLDVYRRLSRRAHEKGSDIQREISFIEVQIGNLSPPDDDAIAVMQEAVDALKTARKKLKAESEQFRKQSEWFAELDQRTRALTRATEDRDAAERAWRDGESRRELLDRANRAWRIRSELDRADNAAKTVAALETKIPDVESELQQVNETLKAATATRKETAARLKTAQAEQARLQPDLQKAAALDVRIEESQKHLVELQADLETRREEEHRCAEAVDARDRAQEKRKKRLETLDQWIHTQKDVRAVYENRTYVYAGVEDLLKQRDLTDQLKQNIETYEQKRLKAEETLAGLRKKQATVQDEDAALASAMAQYQAEMLREHLEPGTPCPVCGSTDHPYAGESEEGVTIPARDDPSPSDFENLQAAKEAVEDRLERLHAKIRETEMAVTAIKVSIGSASEQYKKTLNANETLAGKLDPYLSDISAVWETVLARESDGFLEDLKSTVEQYREKLTERDALETENQEHREHMASERSELKALRQKLEERTDECRRVQRKHATLVDERAVLLDGRDTDAVRKRLEDAVAGAEQDRDKALKRHTDLTIRAETLGAELMSLEKQRVDAASTAAAANAALEQALKTVRMDAAAVREHIGKGAEWLEAEQAAVTELRTRRENAGAVLESRRKDLEAWRARDDRPNDDVETIQEKLAAIEAQQADQDAEFEAATLALQQATAVRQQMADLLSQRDAVMARGGVWQKLRQLIGSHDGSKFSRFAQRLTLETLIDLANERLRELAPRYRLFCPAEDTLDLAVRDRDLAGEERSVNTLSGGEGFLVSLALALGLARLSSRRTRIGTLFIDEGFGALDAASLENVLQALETLGSGGRTVGIISHVPAIRERLTRQIQVRRIGSGWSELEIV